MIKCEMTWVRNLTDLRSGTPNLTFWPIKRKKVKKQACVYLSTSLAEVEDLHPQLGPLLRLGAHLGFELIAAITWQPLLLAEIFFEVLIEFLC